MLEADEMSPLRQGRAYAWSFDDLWNLEGFSVSATFSFCVWRLLASGNY